MAEGGKGGAGASSSSGGDDLHKQRYIFGNRGVVRELIYPNKAILHFRLSGRDEKAILLAKSLTVDGRAVEDGGKPLSDVLRVGDEVQFDCHVYDKGGAVGTGKDRCNYFAIKAAKNSREYEAKHGGSGAGGAAGGAAASGQGGQGRKDLLQVCLVWLPYYIIPLSILCLNLHRVLAGCLS